MICHKQEKKYNMVLHGSINILHFVCNGHSFKKQYNN